MKGSRRLWPWIIIGTLAIVVAVFLGSFVVRLMNPPIEPTVEEGGVVRVIQIDVINGSGVAGAGRKTMMFLRERGFDVVELSTKKELVAKSSVIDRVGDRTSATRVARVLGIADSMVVNEIDSQLFVRASVVLGKDLGVLEPFAN